MPIPVIPILAAVGAGTLGFFIGRETAPCPADAIGFDDADEDDLEDEELQATSHASGSEGPGTDGPGSEGEEAGRGDAADAPWANMSREEALGVLELAPDATPEAIRKAHRRLTRRIHPDRGGSRYLAAAVDRAKVVLLG